MNYYWTVNCIWGKWKVRKGVCLVGCKESQKLLKCFPARMLMVYGSRAAARQSVNYCQTRRESNPNGLKFYFAYGTKSRIAQCLKINRNVQFAKKKKNQENNNFKIFLVWTFWGMKKIDEFCKTFLQVFQPLYLSKYLCTFLMRTETHALGKQKGHETTIFFTMHLQQCVLVQCNTNGKKKLKMQALQSSQYFFHYMKSFLHLSKNALSQRKCPWN